MPLPSLFISHGAPTLVFDDSPARDFLRAYGRQIGRPRAIVIASAHFGTSRPAVVGDPQPGMIYDFGGMPELRQLVYPAPGDPVVAMKVAGLLAAAGFAPAVVNERGFDHGTWVPLMLLYPNADIPVVQLSLQPQLGPAHHLAVGRALESLRHEDVLVIGSGSATHNLQAFFAGGHAAGAPAVDWVSQFNDWMRERIERGSIDDLVNYRALAPGAVENHPTDEHLLPLYIALGAGGEDRRRLHASYRHGVLSMDTYAFA
jgi:4,5-DOPA dioxygenase extradiol